MAEPLAPWGNSYSFGEVPNLIWYAELDQRYQVEVHRTSPDTGNLYIFDHEDNAKQLMELGVNLSYGAQFGPDLADVQQWERIVIEFIDKLNNKN